MSRSKTRGLVLALIALVCAALGSSGCGNSALVDDYCYAMCDCEGCTDEEREMCGIRQEARFDVADVYGCSEEYEEYRTCVVEKADCQDDGGGEEFFAVECDADGCDCESKSEDYRDCVDDASKEELIDFD